VAAITGHWLQNLFASNTFRGRHNIRLRFRSPVLKTSDDHRTNQLSIFARQPKRVRNLLLSRLEIAHGLL
jgi:hypothetical protein